MVLFYLVLFFVGLLVLAKSSSYLIDGSSSIAEKFNISPLVIGLTIVAFGTSLPELMVTVSASLSGSTEIALANIIGSSTFNILVILGISAIIFPIQIRRSTTWKEIPFSLLAALLVLFFAAGVFINFGTPINFGSSEIIDVLSKNYGLVLLSVFVIFMYYAVGLAKSSKEEPDITIVHRPLWKSSLLVILGVIGLGLSAKFLVTDSAIFIARYLNVSEALIGLTLVSVGTSLPELATSANAALKKKSDIAVGNIVGSNIFNLLLVLGIALLIKDIPITGQAVFDIIFLVIATVILFILVVVLRKYKLNKTEGLVMLGLYLAYIYYVFIRG